MTTKTKIIAGSVAGVVAVITAVALGVALSAKSSGAVENGCSYTDYRLRPAASPLSYAVYWKPRFSAPLTFEGRTVIDTVMTADGQACIQLHAYSSLNFSSVGVELASNPGAIVPATYAWNPVATTERVIVTLPSTLNNGDRLKLHFNFSSPLGQDLVGLYLSTYTDDGGNTVNIVTTQFEATYARRAFPSFDEPAYKASFNMTLDAVPAGFTALSNMPVASTTPNPDGTSLVAFQSTPRMSTYLVAAVVAPMIKVTGTAGFNNVAVSVWAMQRGDNAHLISYALDAGMRVLNYYEQVFGVPFPLPKMDMVAIPDFAAGAMENWGLITYRETALLGNTTISTASELQRITVVVAHEIAHQWFGNLVTMQWWDALWLNEGDASLWEYLGTNAVHPEFQIARQFQVTDILAAMQATWYGHTRKLISTVSSSADIEAQFDGVSYSFGASILYTLKNFIEATQPSAYTQGMANYLQKHAYGNAEPADFWAALQASAGLPNLPAQMTTYTSQIGYPVLTVSWANGDGPTTGVGSLTVSQARHFLSPYAQQSAPAGTAGPTTWWIPLTLYGEHPDASSGVYTAITAAAAQGGFSSATWATTIGDSTHTYSIARDGWVKLNANFSGYYRVNYPSNLWSAFSTSLAAQLASNSSFAPMGPADRAQLLNDLFTFAYGTIDQASGTNMAAFLNFSRWLAYETQYEPWTVGVSALAQLRQLLIEDTPLALAADEPQLRGALVASPRLGVDSAQCLTDLSTYAQAVLSYAVSVYGFTGGDGSPLSDLTRTSVLSAASIFNVSSVIATANTYYQGGIASVPVNVQSVVLASAVRWAPTQETWDEVFNLYLNEADANTRRRYLSALSATRDRSLLTRLLSNSLDSSVIRSQDTVSVITAVAANAAGRDLAWKFLKANWATLNTRYGSGGFSLSSLVFGTASHFQSQAYLDDVTSFYEVNPVPAAVLDYQQALETIGTNMGWVATDLTNTCAWLRKYATGQA